MRKILSLYLAVSLLVLSGCASQVTRNDDLIQQGIEAYQAHQLDSAEGFFRKAQQNNPDDPYAAYYLGMIYESEGRRDEARWQYLSYMMDADKVADAEQRTMMDANTRAGLMRIYQSYVQELDAMGHFDSQMIPVEVEVVEVVVEQGPTYWAQTGAFNKRANAEQFIGIISDRYPDLLAGLETKVSEVNGLFKVRTGVYDSLNAANVLCKSIRKRGGDCFPVKEQ